MSNSRDLQDDVYLSQEADNFFLRWRAAQGSLGVGSPLRDGKAQLHDLLSSHTDVSGKNVLEVGCFIGDHLAHLKSDLGCVVSGIEPSQMACDFAKSQFGLELECATFFTSQLLRDPRFRHHFDVVIVDDVLSWVSRALILDAVAKIDSVLRPGGHILLRDFSPPFGFAVENHHVLGQSVYNFKQPGGHAQFFLLTGMYVPRATFARVSDEFQMRPSSRPDSAIWSDSLLQKLHVPLHPAVEL